MENLHFKIGDYGIAFHCNFLQPRLVLVFRVIWSWSLLFYTLVKPVSN